MTIFMIACYSGHINIVKYLLEVGANPSVVDNVSISFSFSFLSDFIVLLICCVIVMAMILMIVWNNPNYACKLSWSS